MSSQANSTRPLFSSTIPHDGGQTDVVRGVYEKHTGLGLRIVAGAALIATGIATGATGGTILAVVGAVPLAAGLANVCLFAPLFGVGFTGRKRTTS